MSNISGPLFYCNLRCSVDDNKKAWSGMTVETIDPAYNETINNNDYDYSYSTTSSRRVFEVLQRSTKQEKIMWPYSAYISSSFRG